MFLVGKANQQSLVLQCTYETSNSLVTSIPCWKDKVQPERDCAFFWYSIWVHMGQPRDGEVAQIRGAIRARS